MITAVKTQQAIISCLDITVPLMTPSTPAYRNKYCRHHSAVSRNRFLNYCVTIANYHHHCRDLYVNSSRQSKLINFFSSLPLTQYTYIYIQNAYLIKTSETKKKKRKRKARHPSLFFYHTIQLVYILQFEEQFIRFFLVCI